MATHHMLKAVGIPASVEQFQLALDCAVAAGKALGEGLQKQLPASKECPRCNTSKKCAVFGCSPNTWESETKE